MAILVTNLEKSLNFKEAATYVDKEVVVDENIITSQGPGATSFFALKIIRTLKR